MSPGLPNLPIRPRWQARRKIDALKADISELTVLKRAAQDITRYNAELRQIQNEIERVESELAATGSVETIEDVQKKLDAVSANISDLNESIRKVNREKENQRNATQSFEAGLSKANLDLMRARHALKERQGWEQRKDTLRNQISELETRLKTIDAEAREAAGPIRKLEDSLQELKSNFDRRERELQKKQEQYDKSLRQLDSAKVAIER